MPTNKEGAKARKREYMRVYQAKRRLVDPAYVETQRKAAARWRAENPDKWKEQYTRANRRRMMDPERYAEANREAQRRWREKNKDKLKVLRWKAEERRKKVDPLKYAEAKRKRSRRAYVKRRTKETLERAARMRALLARPREVDET